ncbi:MAG: class I SAM-dependent rRNA methyltransferase [Bacteroidetes bacterium]|jgi:23S rRNA (cytosine1962-C5)-methyltransferase|nr:class I SAM-dependent rRNA methyltransferase [Bacteroidota bacterium]MBK7039641.1 class I SAM-dependent rRNA methyltransferase [Bacteroidota bacterium]MBK8329795.1 class I SAM-dependent rRNA methyltransferase [Bacteroidota bacterium]MBK9301654.1 class I SAM-dependent rRNA methyltransferase [Bacteroidota bacterium]MBK9481705.1 class I SAM-dependent rRNA methyltransferase [Bacteroidota bacterium]
MKAILNSKISDRVAKGHPWIYNNEINSVDAKAQPGNIVEVYNAKGNFVGRGFYNPASQIQIRLLTRDLNEEINDDFFYQKILACWQYKAKIGYTENCRVVFGEADGLPSLIIDKFNDYLVIQTMSLGMDVWKDAIVKALHQIFNPKGIYERNDVPVREIEGMEQKKGFLSAPFNTEIIIQENGLKFIVDIEKGQKTGYFLDQRDNRRQIQQIVKDAEVLEAFCYTGTFSIHAAHYGAKKVLGLDISDFAIETAKRNATLNGLDQICDFQSVNAFDALKQWSKEDKRWDVVMLDPPAFTKSRANIQKALAGYKEINLRAMKLVKKGGFLVTASCTNLVSPEMFLDTIKAAAKDAKRPIRQVCFRAQAADHPIVWHIENTNYLKFLIIELG